MKLRGSVNSPTASKIESHISTHHLCPRVNALGKGWLLYTHMSQLLATQEHSSA